MTSKLPTYFISHGGGPWPYIPEMRARMTQLELSLQDMPRQIGVLPKAVLVISGHWEEVDAYAVMSSPKPPMLYDYSGFPGYAYQVVYPAPGDPGLASRIHDLIAANGLPVRLDSQRGFDHGTFAPLVVMYPEANVPVVQLSLRSHMKPEEHLALGRALAPLRSEGVLIVGSGLSYHNLRRLGPASKEPSEAFDAWLQNALVVSSPAERTALIANWASAPGARQSHPREDHLIPLMVALGAAEADTGACVYHETNAMGGMTASSFRFGEANSNGIGSMKMLQASSKG
jgi:aromatic ring-opening dioxygenase catalytic subunit (LigB family)